MADLEGSLLKMLNMGPWQKAQNDKPPKGPTVSLALISKALEKIGSPCPPDQIIEPLLNVKGKGWVQTQPRIIEKQEWPKMNFQLWLTGLGMTELQKRGGGG